jgi:CheY-like chemotaxis protein
VGSAEQALEALRGGDSYDICVMDLRLPGMDGARGIVVLHTLCPTLRFIIHTGSYNYALSDELRAIGIEERHLLRKPLADMGLLAARVRELAGT